MFLAWGFGVYFFFASLMLLSIVFVFLFVPETKGIPLEAMDQLFASKPIWRAHDHIMAELHDRDDEFRRNVEGGDSLEEEKTVDKGGKP